MAKAPRNSPDLDTLIDALACAFDREESVELLDRAGFPRSHIPPHEHPYGFWASVIEMATRGLLPGGVMAIVRAAATMRPADLFFAIYAADDLVLNDDDLAYDVRFNMAAAAAPNSRPYQHEDALESDESPRKTPVHLGASAPRFVRPGDEFVARLTAYHPKFIKAAKEALRQADAFVYPELKKTAWRQGVKVRVFLSGTHIRVQRDAQEFVWDGKFKTIDFDVKVRTGEKGPTRTLLRFDLYIRSVRVARVRVPVRIRAKSSWPDRLRSSRQRTFGQLAYQTAYASYEKKDAEVALGSIRTLTHLTDLTYTKTACR